VAQTCQRVVIINRGRVVAVDTPDNLTRRLDGAQTMYIQVDGDGAAASAALGRLAGIARVTEVDRKEGCVGFEVESEAGRDLRVDIARAVVNGGWGLLELRPQRMSLEEIFLQLTTEEHSGEAAVQ
jgi:ABC-2 type transport system ATP-binding protein